MAILYKSDLTAVDAYADAALANEPVDSDKVINNINSFISSSSGLTGEVWDKERERLKSYIDALEKRKTVSTQLLSSIKAANKIMAAYIASFPIGVLAKIPNLNIPANASLDFVDDSWIGDLETCLQKAQTNYDSYKAKKTTTNQEKINKNKQLYYYDSIIQACKTVIDYLEQLQPTAQTAYSEYDAVAGELAALQSLNYDVNQKLFDNIDGRRDKVNTQTVYVHTGGGSYTPPVTSTSTAEETVANTPETTLPVENPTQEVNNHAPTVSESSSPSVAPSGSAPAPTISVSSTVSAPVTIEEEPTIDVEPEESTTTPSVGNAEPTPSTSSSEPPIGTTDQTPSIPEETITPSTPSLEPIPAKQNNKTKTIGIGLVGAAAVGAAAYGAYNVTQKMKESNDFESDGEESSPNYDDQENIDINYDNNDI